MAHVHLRTAFSFHSRLLSTRSLVLDPLALHVYSCTLSCVYISRFFHSYRTHYAQLHFALAYTTHNLHASDPIMNLYQTEIATPSTAPCPSQRAMQLLDLPPEIFQHITHDLVSATGPGGAWEYRTICRTFAAEIAHDVFAKSDQDASRRRRIFDSSSAASTSSSSIASTLPATLIPLSSQKSQP
jgi:hypothetical protein